MKMHKNRKPSEKATIFRHRTMICKPQIATKMWKYPQSDSQNGLKPPKPPDYNRAPVYIGLEEAVDSKFDWEKIGKGALEQLTTISMNKESSL